MIEFSLNNNDRITLDNFFIHIEDPLIVAIDIRLLSNKFDTSRFIYFAINEFNDALSNHVNNKVSKYQISDMDNSFSIHIRKEDIYINLTLDFYIMESGFRINYIDNIKSNYFKEFLSEIVEEIKLLI